MLSWIIGIIICLIFSAFFSASEISFASARKSRLRSKAEGGNHGAKIAYKISLNFNEALSTILIGNNLVNIAASSISTLLLMQLLGREGGATLISTALMTVIVLIVGEITPKIIAKQIAEDFAVFSARPLSWLMTIFKPLNSLVLVLMSFIYKLWPPPANAIILNEARLSSIIEKVEGEGIIDEDASDLLQSALEFPDLTVSAIVTPRVDMQMIDLGDSMEEIMQEVLTSPFSRIPVYEGNVDNIKGILHAISFLKVAAERLPSKEEFRASLKEEISIPESMKLPKAFSILNQGQNQMAIVIDEYGGTVGCVTIEDLLEELVGDIWDEADEVENDLISVAEGKYLAKGSLALRDLIDELDLREDLFTSEYNSLAGFLLEKFERFPELGESLRVANLLCTITALDERKIEEVEIEIVALDDEDI